MATNVQGPTPENAEWAVILEELEIPYRQRRLSGALFALCQFHDEKSPSMFMWPDGNLYCHGCNVQMSINEFLPEVHAGAVVQEEWQAHDQKMRQEIPGWDEPPF